LSTYFVCGNLSGVDGRIILKWVFKMWDGEAWSELDWLCIGTGGGCWWMRWWTFGFHKMRGISCSWRPVRFSRRTLFHGVQFSLVLVNFSGPDLRFPRLRSVRVLLYPGSWR